MKKFALFALAALCVSAAQAVTINWTLKIGGPDAQTDAAGNAPGWVGLVMLAGEAEPVIKNNGAITQNGSDYTLAGDLANATKIAVTDSANYAELKAITTLNFSTEVTTDAVTFVLFNIWNTNDSSVTGGYAFLTVTDIDTSATTLTMDLSDTTFEWSKNNVYTTTVPEPTALALLALGVAGLALKRKLA